MKYLLIVILCLFVAGSYAQPNCDAFKYMGDTLKYQACKVAERRAGHYQFSRAYQEAFDDALAIDSSFAYAYREKSTAYLKSGDFPSWIQLMNKAVHYDPLAHLDYRGWCRYQFFRDYEGTIKDIEMLDSLVDYDIGHSQNGDYHLQIARALCYKALGNSQKAIDIIETQLAREDHFEGMYDYLHLGVLYMEVGNFPKALQALQKQQELNDLAENRYYLAIVQKQFGQQKASNDNLRIAREKYQSNMRMFDPYVMPMDKIFLEDIDKALEGTDN